jgi:hypothetical protein
MIAVYARQEKRMSDPSIARFLAYLNGDHETRSRVEKLEQALAAAFRREAQSIAAIASHAGFDVAGWDARPGVKEPARVKSFGCCGFMTRGTEAVEKALGS